MKNETFVVGKEKIPQWFNDQASIGRAKVNKDEDGELLNIIIYGPTGNKIAKIGDSVMNTRSGLVVIPEEKAKKYNVQETRKNIEELRNGNTAKQTT